MRLGARGFAEGRDEHAVEVVHGEEACEERRGVRRGAFERSMAKGGGEREHGGEGEADEVEAIEDDERMLDADEIDLRDGMKIRSVECWKDGVE